jgi:phage tail sheath protein FI
MPQYMTPGVYVEEIPSASKPIEGVSTSVAAFVGLAPFGPVNTAVQVSNWGQFERTFGNPHDPHSGPFMKGAYLAHAVYGFFHNGGTICYVVRVGSGSAPEAPQLELPAEGQTGMGPYRAVARRGVPDPVKITLTAEASGKPEVGGGKDSGNGNANSAPGVTPTYSIEITAGPDDKEGEPPSQKTEILTGLTLQKGNQYIVTKVNRDSTLIALEETAPAPLAMRPPLKTGDYNLKSGGVIAPLEADDVTGNVAERTGLDGLGAIDEVTMVCVPDIMAITDEAQRNDLQQKMVDHCERAMDRMAILDSPPDLSPQDVRTWRESRGASKFAALYYPWVEVMDPIDNQPIMVPPCGHVAGAWARTDATRGVHKAPANEVVMGANGLSFQVTDAEQANMNREGINCIRAFPGRGIRIWGARTMSTLADPEWRYINVRRLFNFVSESINEGTQWAVFEPNDASLWTQLRISSTNFLTRIWRDGALFGATPGEAFYVKCDAETNPPDLVEAGQVTVEIGIAPVKPAEFVVFRISQFQVGAEA